MEILRNIIIFCFVAVSVSAQGQNAFYKKYASSVFDSGNGVVQLPDSSYAITGSSGAFDAYSSQAYLMFTDKGGNQLLTKSYGGDGDDIGVRVMHIPNEGFFIAGYTNSTIGGDYDFVLYKTDEQGNLLWEKHYGTENWEKLNDAILLPDGGVVMVGQTEGLTTQLIDIFMVRTDAMGDTLWTKTLATPENDIAYALDTISANAFILAGDHGNNGASAGMLAKYDFDGNQEWMQFYEQQGQSTIRTVKIFDNWIYAFGGIAIEEEDGGFYKWGIEVRADGQYNGYWSGSQMASSLFNAMVIRDASSMFIGYYADAEDVNPYESGNDAFVMKFFTDLYYNDLSVNLSGKGEDIINQMIVTLDSGIVVVGTSSQSSFGSTDYYLGSEIMLAKIGPDDEVASTPTTAEDLVAINEESVLRLPIFPNPTKDMVYLPEEVLSYPFELTDFQGKVVLQGNVESTLNTGELEVGIYFLNVFGKDQVWKTKLIKQ